MSVAVRPVTGGTVAERNTVRLALRGCVGDTWTVELADEPANTARDVGNTLMKKSGWGGAITSISPVKDSVKKPPPKGAVPAMV